MKKEKLTQLLKDASNNHYQILVLAGNYENKEELKDLLVQQNYTEYNINLEVSKIVQDIPVEKRALRVGTAFKDWINTLPEKNLIFDNIEILFSSDIGKINPVMTIRYSTRKGLKNIVLFLPAKVRGTRAYYSEEGNPDYLEMDLAGMIYEEGDL